MEELRKYLEEQKQECESLLDKSKVGEFYILMTKINTYNEIINYIDNIKNK